MTVATTPEPSDVLPQVVLILEESCACAQQAEPEICRALGPCRFRRVETQEQLLAVFDESSPALIISDFKLREFDGLTALRLAQGLVPDVPFIFLTDSLNEDTAVECIKAGAWDYVIKDHVRRLGAAVRSAQELGRLRQERRAAELQREQLMAAIEQVAEAIALIDLQEVVRFANPAFEAITGYSRSEILGRTVGVLDGGQQDEALHRAMWETISHGKTWRGRFISRRKDGACYHEEATISPVRNQAGMTTSYVVVKRDITHELELEAQFLQAQKMEGIGRLAGGVAHDFNNLLSVILSYTGLALEAVGEGNQLGADLLEIKQAGEQAAALTRQLLAFSRRQLLQPEPLDLNQVTVNLQKMFGRVLGEDIEVVLALATELHLVVADRTQIEQVIMNLIVNARDAMALGGRLTLATSNEEFDGEPGGLHAAMKPGSYVLLEISDSGCGMDSQTRAHLFEPFFTTKEPGRGTGLGLSTVYGIVKQSNGFIWVDSEPGEGTTFQIYLPRARSGAIPRHKTPLRPLNASGKETILVVEDEQRVRTLVTRLLEGLGYDVLTAASGEEALQAAEHHPGEIHLLLTDVVMPKMSGLVVAERLADLRPQTRVLYMSGYSDEAINRHGLLEPGVEFIAKPFNQTDLASRVRGVLDGAAPSPSPPPTSRSPDQFDDASGPRGGSSLAGVVLNELKRAVTCARFDDIKALLEKVRAQDPVLVAELSTMLQRFDYEGIIARLER